MRLAVFAWLLSCASGLAAADETPQAPAATAPTSAAPASAAPAPAPTASPPASTPETSESVAAAKMDQHLRSEGYTVQVRNGEKLYCKRIEAIGSRLSASTQCAPAMDIIVRERQVQDDQQKRQLMSSQPMH